MKSYIVVQRHPTYSKHSSTNHRHDPVALLEFDDYCCEPEPLRQIFCSYLTAGNYRCSAFLDLDAVLVVNGLLLFEL